MLNRNLFCHYKFMGLSLLRVKHLLFIEAFFCGFSLAVKI